MHPHLHTQDNTGCEQVMKALDECHARGFLFRCIGGCNDAKHAVNMCLRAERVERTRLNREKAKIKRAEAEAVWAQIDAES